MARILETEEIEIKSGAVETVSVKMKEQPIPGTGIPGYPETQCCLYVISDLPFLLKHIEVDPELAPQFKVVNVYIGADRQWDVHPSGVSCEILNKRPDIKFKRCEPMLSIVLSVRNATDDGVVRKFKARLVGEDDTSEPVVRTAEPIDYTRLS